MIGSTHRLLEFYKHFFITTNCTIETITNHTLTVQLTTDMDKAIMNRPYYWSYIETMQLEGQPQKITLSTTKNNLHDTIFAYYDTPIYHRISEWLKANTKYGIYYEQVHTSKKTTMFPWLILNIKLTYKGKLYKDEILSLGLQLIHGIVEYDMMEKLKTVPLANQISNYCYTITPIISISSGYARLEKVIDSYLEQQSYTWAMQIEQQRANLVKKHAHTEQKYRDELYRTYEQMQPMIHIEVLNGAIVYLT